MNINKIQSTRRVATIWLSGVTASGKTTLGKILYEDLKNSGIVNLKFFDGEDLRKIQDRVYGHSVEERFRLIKKYTKLIKYENEKGYNTIISTVSHKKEMRDFARDQLNQFMEINLLCSSETCAIRDFKNIYSKISKKDNECFPGVTEPYEISKKAELILNTEQNSIEDSRIILLNKTLEFLNENISEGSIRKK